MAVVERMPGAPYAESALGEVVRAKQGETEGLAKLSSVSAVLPAHNEEANIEPVVRRVLANLPHVAEHYEVIVVDDGSRDRTGEIADRLARAYPSVRAIHHPRNRGYGSAWRSGIDAAIGDWIFFMDSDRQFDSAEVVKLVAQAEGHDIVAGYRIKRNDPYHRFLIGSSFNILVKILFGVRVRDIDCGFKLFRASLLKGMDLESPGALINTEIHARANVRRASITEVGVNHYPRVVGEQSGASPRVVLRAVKELLRLRWRLWTHRTARTLSSTELIAPPADVR